jgi:hypothetical protein
MRFLGIIESTEKSLQVIIKKTYFLSTQSGLSIGVGIVKFVKKFFFHYYDQKGGPLPKKSKFFFDT